MKILWHSEYYLKTGFAKVSKALVKELKELFDITVLDWTKFNSDSPATPIEDDGIKFLGAIAENDKFAAWQMETMDLDQYDCIFIINDVWNINELCKLLKIKNYKGKVVCYFPVDAANHDSDWYSDFDIVTVPVTYTKFAFDEVTKAYPECAKNLLTIPHGIDTNLFYPIKSSKYKIREKLFGTSSLNDSFIFLNANRNQPRKRLDITMEAFSMFLKEREIEGDVRLYMHCSNTDTSMDIMKLAKRFGFSDKLIMSQNAGTKNGISETQLNLLYNACDVGINTSMGEGWGLCNTEMAAVGKTQIVPNHSACKELFEEPMSFGMTHCLIKCSNSFTFDNLMTVGQIPSKEDLSWWMNYLYFLKDSDQFREMEDKCHRKFTAEQYLWKNIALQWGSIFSGLK